MTNRHCFNPEGKNQSSLWWNNHIQDPFGPRLGLCSDHMRRASNSTKINLLRYCKISCTLTVKLVSFLDKPERVVISHDGNQGVQADKGAKTSDPLTLSGASWNLGKVWFPF